MRCTNYQVLSLIVSRLVKEFVSLSINNNQMKMLRHVWGIFLLSIITLVANAQIKPAPIKDKGMGPYSQLIIRGAILINGTGAPAIGPVDIVIENNRISNIVVVGAEGGKINEARRPKLA